MKRNSTKFPQKVNTSNPTVLPTHTSSSSIAGDFVSGIGLGFGSGIGHNAANAIFSTNNSDTNTCKQLLEVYKQCKEKSIDCSYLEEMIKQCK
jgi:hypothetical protein